MQGGTARAAARGMLPVGAAGRPAHLTSQHAAQHPGVCSPAAARNGGFKIVPDLQQACHAGAVHAAHRLWRLPRAAAHASSSTAAGSAAGAAAPSGPSEAPKALLHDQLNALTVRRGVARWHPPLHTPHLPHTLPFQRMPHKPNLESHV